MGQRMKQYVQKDMRVVLILVLCTVKLSDATKYISAYQAS